MANVGDQHRRQTSAAGTRRQLTAARTQTMVQPMPVALWRAQGGEPGIQPQGRSSGDGLAVSTQTASRCPQRRDEQNEEARVQDGVLPVLGRP